MSVKCLKIVILFLTLGAVTACMANPCLNGGKCTDNGAHDKYTCICTDGYSGKQCQGKN